MTVVGDMKGVGARPSETPVMLASLTYLEKSDARSLPAGHTWSISENALRTSDASPGRRAFAACPGLQMTPGSASVSCTDLRSHTLALHPTDQHAGVPMQPSTEKSWLSWSM